MKSLKDRWDEQKASDFNIEPPKEEFPEYSFKTAEVTDKDRDTFKKMLEDLRKKKTN